MTQVEAEVWRRRPASSSLLHNMSCRPNTAIIHRAEAGRVYGRGIAFVLPAEVESDNSANLLAWSDASTPTSEYRDASAELVRRIQEHAATLELPAAAVVTDARRKNDTECQDRLSILTVLAKSSSNVYLRDKYPNLSLLRPGRRVVLIVPPSWES